MNTRGVEMRIFRYDKCYGLEPYRGEELPLSDEPIPHGIRLFEIFLATDLADETYDVLPEGCENFKAVMEICDAVAQALKGRLHARINFKLHTAKVVVTASGLFLIGAPYREFLQKLNDYSYMAYVQPYGKNLELTVHVKYFRAAMENMPQLERNAERYILKKASDCCK